MFYKHFYEKLNYTNNFTQVFILIINNFLFDKIINFHNFALKLQICP